jgi:hypothetical protein
VHDFVDEDDGDYNNYYYYEDGDDADGDGDDVDYDVYKDNEVLYITMIDGRGWFYLCGLCL